MLTGLQIQINALHAIVPDSFIFVLDSIDGSFIYKSSDCSKAIERITSLDRSNAIENLINSTGVFYEDSDRYSCIIRKLESDAFLGIFVLKEKYSENSIKSAKDYFLQLPINLN